MFNKPVRIVSAICACLLWAAPVFSHGALITWVLSGVTLRETSGSYSPGRLFGATGSFAYDAQTHTVATWSITTIDPLIDSRAVFAPDDPCHAPGCTNTADWNPGQSATTDSFRFAHIDISPGSSRSFELVTEELTDAGGTKLLLSGLGGYSRGGSGQIRSEVAAGSLIAVPEPASAVALLLGLGLLFGSRRLVRRTQ